MKEDGKKKILVVDDNRMMLNFMTGTLEREGHEVVAAEDGFSALNILTTFTPDIMFVDLIMPNIGGDQLCKIVRRMQNMENCYLVILSGVVAEMDLDYIEIGANNCIAKGPFDKMAQYIKDAIAESDRPLRKDLPQGIKGLNDVYARQMTKELLSRNRHLRTILESIAEGILEVYSKKIVYANLAAESLFGMPQEKLLASCPPDLFDDATRLRIESLLKPGVKNSREIGHNTPIELNKRQVLVKSLPVKDEEPTSILLITDITERKRLQMQLQHAQKMEAIGTIASGVAHNFRNTLAGILVNSQMIQMNYKEISDLMELAERIDISVKRGVQLVEGLMQFSRKQIKKEFKKINLSKVIEEIYCLITESFDKKINIVLDIPESLYIMGDHAGLSQALMNLCTNARDAIPLEGELRIEAIKEKNRAAITVSDTGEGMDKETMEQCFDPFFTTKEVGRGTGLGLSTSYGIIKSHDGKIVLNSDPGSGTTFKLYFPLADYKGQYSQKNLHEIIPGNGETVLVVDDETEILKTMQDMLENLGYKAEIAGSGKEAIEKYRQVRPDLVLMDISMPEMSGISCIEKITDFDPDIKVIIISGYDERNSNILDDRIKKLTHEYLTKPVGLDELSATLARLLRSDV